MSSIHINRSADFYYEAWCLCYLSVCPSVRVCMLHTHGPTDRRTDNIVTTQYVHRNRFLSQYIFNFIHHFLVEKKTTEKFTCTIADRHALKPHDKKPGILAPFPPIPRHLKAARTPCEKAACESPMQSTDQPIDRNAA